MIPVNRVFTKKALLLVVCQPRGERYERPGPPPLRPLSGQSGPRSLCGGNGELDLVKEQVALLLTRSETLKLALGYLAAVVVALLPL